MPRETIGEAVPDVYYRSKMGCLTVALLCLATVLTGCDEKQIQSYTVEKDPEPKIMLPIAWELPGGWSEKVNAGGGMRYATITAVQGNDTLSFSVIKLAGDGGGVFQNIARWWGQIDAPAPKEDEFGKSITIRQSDTRRWLVVDKTGNKKDETTDQPLRILGLIMGDGHNTWFIKAMAASPEIEPFKATFETFAESIEFPAADLAAKQAPSAPPVAPRPPTPPPSIAARAQPTWTAPEGWVAGPPSQFVMASFNVTAGEHKARVTITQLGGTAGGVLANINRWRGQVGLAPVAELGEQQMQTVQVGGSAGALLDLTSEGDDAARSRMLVVLVPRPDGTWFFKMTGPSLLLEAERAKFVSFVESVNFGGAAEGGAGTGGE